MIRSPLYFNSNRQYFSTNESWELGSPIFKIYPLKIGTNKRGGGGRGEVVSRSYLASSSSFNGENRYIPFLSLNPSLPLPMLLSSCIKHAGTIVWGGKRKWRNGKQIQRWMVANDGIFQGSPRFVFVPFQLEANRRATLKVPTNHPASQRTCFHLLRKLKGNLTPRTKSIWDTEILIAAKELRSIIVYFLPLRVR